MVAIRTIASEFSKEVKFSGESNEVNKPSNNHSVTQGRIGSLKTEDKPNSSIDLYDKKGNLLQRRFYGEDGKATLDVDFSHGNGDGSHSFLHKHIWDWSKDYPQRLPE